MLSRTVGLLAISQHPIYSKRLATPLIIAGTTLFSGSIFALLLYREKCVRSFSCAVMRSGAGQGGVSGGELI